MPILPTTIMELIVIKIGLYDTWVARDVCGTPLRPFWPFVKDQATMSRVRDQKPFEVSSCWNGAVVFPAKPYIYSPPTPPTPPTTTNLRRRGWKMIDNCSPPPPPPPLPDHFRRLADELLSVISRLPRVPRPRLPHPIPFLRHRRLRPLRVLLIQLRPPPSLPHPRTASTDIHEPERKGRLSGELVSVA